MSKTIIDVDPQKFPWLDLNRYTFCMAAESTGVVYLAGQTASTYDSSQGRVVCKGDLIEQTKVVFEKLAVVLEAAGLGFDNVVQTVDYVDPVGLPQYRQTAEVRRQYLGDTPVAATGICVERLLRSDALIEVSAVAMRGEKQVIDLGWERYRQLTYAPAVEVDDVVWLSGLIGNEEAAGELYYPQDTARQVELCYQTVGQVLQAAGAQPGDIVKSLDYIAPAALLQYANTGEVRRQFYAGQYPAASGVIANRLLRPEGHVEIEAVAVKSGIRQEIRVDEWDRSYGGLTYHPGIKKGHLIQLSGQAAVDHVTGQSVGGFDMVAQAEQAYSNIAQVLAAGGYSMDDVVNTIEWVAPNGIRGYRAVQEVRRKHFGDSFPSATGVSVHRMIRPELLFEVTAVAVV